MALSSQPAWRCMRRPIKYWACSSKIANLCFAATTGGIDKTSDKGLTWKLLNTSLLLADSRGTFVDHGTSPATIYHATPAGIY